MRGELGCFQIKHKGHPMARAFFVVTELDRAKLHPLKVRSCTASPLDTRSDTALCQWGSWSCTKAKDSKRLTVSHRDWNRAALPMEHTWSR